MMLRGLNSVLRDECGAMDIETVIVAPVLVLMALGAFEVGSVVSRQQELQSAASEAEGIILAASGGTGADSAQIEAVIEDSLGLSETQVTLQQRFRCNTATAMVTNAADCGSVVPIYQYVQLQVTDTYTPVWTKYGVGSPVSYSVSRTVQVQ